MDTLLLRRAFIDRSGRIVYHGFPVEQVQTEDGAPMLQEGPAVCMMRLAPFDEDIPVKVEWFQQEEPAPKTAGFVPGTEIGGDGTG